MKINKREKLLGIVTAVIIITGIITQTPLFEQIKSLSSSSAEFENKIKDFRVQQERLIKGIEITKQYKEIEDRFPAPKEGQKPEHVFSEEVDKLCKSLGFQYPTIDPPEWADIEDVDEYKFITLNVRTRGDIASVSKLLKGISEKRLIIKEINLKGTLDQDIVNTVIKVARIAKADPQAEKTKKRNTRR